MSAHSPFHASLSLRAARALPLALLLALGPLGARALGAQEAAPAGQQPPPPPAVPGSPEPAPPQDAPGAPAGFDPRTLPEVVARVDGRDVTRAELIEEAEGAYAQLRQLGQNPVPDEAFFRAALDQRIASMLLETEARSRGIAATPEEVEARFAEARSRFDTEESFHQSLQAQGLTAEEAKAELGQEISRYKYIESVIVPQIEITEEELRTFYEQNLERMRQPEQMKLRHLLIQVEAGASEEERREARRRAEDLLRRIQAGEDFAALAREHSDDGTREGGGELPWIQRGQTLPEFEQAAFQLQPGEVSPVVETPLGFHLVQALERQPERVAEFDEVKDRIRVVLQSEEAQERLRSTVEDLVARADVERFAL